MIRELTVHAPALGIATACFVLASLLDSWDRARNRRRRHAQAAERHARPPAAQQDAAALAKQAIREGWTGPGGNR